MCDLTLSVDTPLSSRWRIFIFDIYLGQNKPKILKIEFSKKYFDMNTTDWKLQVSELFCPAYSSNFKLEVLIWEIWDVHWTRRFNETNFKSLLSLKLPRTASQSDKQILTISLRVWRGMAIQNTLKIARNIENAIKNQDQWNGWGHHDWLGKK